MTKLYLHIGTPKTGTKSIQRFLLDNHDRLLEQGILYPISPGLCDGRAHFKFSDVFKNPDVSADEFAETVEALHEDIRNNNPDSVVISAETFWSCTNIDTLKEALSPYDVTVIVFLRRQDKQLVSGYNQMRKAREIVGVTADKFQEQTVYYHKYSRRLDYWADVFGRESITVQPFEESQFQGTLQETFCALTGITIKDDFEIVDMPLNASLGLDLVHYLEWLPFSSKAFKYNYVVPALRGYAEQSQDETVKAFTSKELCEYVEQFQDDNQYIAKAYLKRDDGVLFQDPLPDKDEDGIKYKGLSFRKKIIFSFIVFKAFCKGLFKQGKV